MGEPIKVLKRYCDEPMAKKRKLLPCDKNCKNCFACIEVLTGGEKRHAGGKGRK